MKKLLLIAIAFCTFTACDDEDNSKLWDEVNNQGNKIEMLEGEMEALKLKIEGLNETFKAMTAMLNGGFITEVKPITEGDKTGYAITVQTSSGSSDIQVETYNIWNGTDGKNGSNGTNGSNGDDGAPGSTPQIGVEKEETTGLYYWTVDGTPMSDGAGGKIYTSKAPQLKINNDSGSSVWEISYDDGTTWTELGVFTGSVVSSSITVALDGTGKNVVIKQDGKADITIPIVENKLKINFTNIDATGMKVIKNGVYFVEYTLENASANATVKAEALNSANLEVENLPAEKKIKVTVKGQNTGDAVLVHVYDGTVCMHTSFNITLDPAIKAITIDEPEVILPLEAGSDDVVYEGTLTLPEAATEELTFSVIPDGTYSSDIFTIEPTVTIANGSTTGTYKVTAKRSAMTAGTAYTIPSIIFSGTNANYHVSGSVKMTAGILGKITLTGDSYYASSNNADAKKLCDGLLPQGNHWESSYNSSKKVFGDPIYGIYIDVTLPQAIVAVKFRYCTRAGNGLPKKLALGVENNEGAWVLLETMEQMVTGNNQWGETPVYLMKDNSVFDKVRFGMTVGFFPSSYTNSKGETDGNGNGILTGYLGGADGGDNMINTVALAELEVWGLWYE